MTFEKALAREAKRLRIPLSGAERRAFGLLHDMLARWNARVNLTGLRRVEDIARVLFAESLLPGKLHGALRGALLDVGSGAGFPALPLAVKHPQLRVTMVEANARKAVFLREAVAALRLPNAVVVDMRLEEAVRREALAPSFAPLPSGEGSPKDGVRAEGYRHTKLPPLLLEFCRVMRKQPTRAEDMLWRCLRDRRMHDFKFRRQHPLGRYIADFYCREAKLVIELDGGVHRSEERKEVDKLRDEAIVAHGIHVLRFWNSQIEKNIQKTLLRIQDALALPSPPSPLPMGEGRNGKGVLSPPYDYFTMRGVGHVAEIFPLLAPLKAARHAAFAFVKKEHRAACRSMPGARVAGEKRISETTWLLKIRFAPENPAPEEE